MGAPVMTNIRTPVYKQLHRRFFHQALGNMLAGVQRGSIGLVDLIRLRDRYQVFCRQVFRVEYARRFMLPDCCIHQGLGRRRFVGFVVTSATITDQVDHNVLVKLITKIHGNLRHEQNRFGFIGIDMKNWRLHHFSHIGTIFGGARIVLSRGSEADLIIDYDVNGSAGCIGPGLGHLERLHDNTLSCKCRIPVNDNSQYQLPLLVFPPGLPGPDGPFHNRGNYFQMGRVERQRHVQFTARGHDVRRKSLVVLYVTGFVVGRLAFKLIE